MTKPSPRLLALYGIRNAVDALIIEEERLAIGEEGRDPESCPKCGADRDHLAHVGTVDGTQRRHCERCGAVFILERGVAVMEETTRGG